MINKVCPLGMIGTRDGILYGCHGERCMFWDHGTCVIKSFLKGEVYVPDKKNMTNEEVV